MATTRQYIAAMTDPGRFEALATAVLRRADPANRAMVHVGANAAGRPQASPVDGAAAGGDGLVFFAHTTARLRDHPTKWLDPIEGDLAKAIRLRQDLCGMARPPKTRIVLTTSQEPRPPLLIDTQKACAESGVELDLWPQSRLADFLDHDPEGQWIRWTFFGEPTVRLSGSLLHDRSRSVPDSLAGFDPPETLVNRDAADGLWDRLQRGGEAILLASDSGQGKTALCRLLWRRHAQSGGACLHITQDDVDAAATLDEALVSGFRRAGLPGPPGAAGEIARLKLERPLLIVIDDLNRSAKLVEALLKVCAWANGLIARAGSALSLIAPAWPRTFAGLPDNALKAAGRFRLDLPPVSVREAQAIARAHALSAGVSVSEHDLAQVVDALGPDPLLLGLHDWRRRPDASISAFVDRQVALAATGDDLSASELHEALGRVADLMLVERTWAPIWSRIRATLPAETPALRRLLAVGTVLRLAGSDRDQTIAFRHDHVRDEILARALAERLDGDPSDEVVGDPFYSELLAQVLARAPTPPTRVARTAKVNPVALFHALGRADPGTEGRARIATAAAEWLKHPQSRRPGLQHAFWGSQTALRRTEEGPRVTRSLRERDAPFRSYAGLDPTRSCGKGRFVKRGHPWNGSALRAI